MRVTLKLATSLDGRIATATGESRWITGEAAREQGHRLRAAHDAVLVGVQTVLADDPELTVRISTSAHPGESRDPVLSSLTPALQDHQAAPDPDSLQHPKNWVPAFAGMSGDKGNPLRVVLDSRLRTPETAKLVGAGTLILTTAEPRAVGGATIERMEADEGGRPAIPAVLKALKRHGVESLLIEGGGQVAASFIAADAVDVIEWFRAPILLGGAGRPCVAALEMAKLSDAPRFRRLAVEPLGDDLWERYERVR